VLGVLAADDTADNLATTIASQDETAVFADGLYGGADFHRRRSDGWEPKDGEMVTECQMGMRRPRWLRAAVDT